MSTARLVLAACIDGVPDTAQVTNAWAKQFYGTIGGVAHRVVYSADVVRARNRVAQHVVDHMPEATHILWWDTDMFVDDHVSLVVEMLASGADVIGAKYARKRKPRADVGIPILNAEAMRTEHGIALPMHAIGFGFTITSMNAIRRVGEGARVYTDACENGERIRTRNIFGLQYIYNGHIDIDERPEAELVTEDWSFCAKWRDYCGGSVWLYQPNRNPDAVSHVGEYAF